MSHYRYYGKSLLSMILVLCLLFGMVPAVAAEPRANPTSVYDANSLLTEVAQLNEAGGGLIELTKNITLAEPLIITSPIEITGSYYITADNGNDRLKTRGRFFCLDTFLNM